VFVDVWLTVGDRARRLPRRLIEPVLNPHLKDGIQADVSTSGRDLFVCATLADGAGAAIAVWSISLERGRDHAWGGEYITDAPPPHDLSCRELAERARKDPRAVNLVDLTR
jgi:hypothetical protein